MDGFSGRRTTESRAENLKIHQSCGLRPSCTFLLSVLQSFPLLGAAFPSAYIRVYVFFFIFYFILFFILMLYASFDGGFCIL